jgi:4-amino-4-deoxy-L-arabinose transferase-like glycosyltransferase
VSERFSTVVALIPRVPPRALLFLLCVALYLPGIVSLPPIDRDEARYAQTTKQMVEGGDFIRPHFQELDRLNKPVGIYWVQSLAVITFAPNNRSVIWPYRIPSMLAAFGAVLFTLKIGRTLFHESTARLAAALLASCALLVVEAHMATTDAALTACTAGAMSSLAAVYINFFKGMNTRVREVVGFWAWLGVGTLIKGPVLPAISLLTVGALAGYDRFKNYENTEPNRSRAWLWELQPKWGLPLALAIVAPWMIAITLARGNAFYHQAIWVDFLPRLTRVYESHGGPPGYYMLTSVATFWPGSLIALPALVLAFKQTWRPEIRFCLAWLVPGWILFEIIPTKLPHYALPLFPALALLVAEAALRPAAQWRYLIRKPVGLIGAGAWALTATALGLVALAAPILLDAKAGIYGVICAVVVTTVIVVGLRLAVRGKIERTLLFSIGGAAITYAILLQWELPHLSELWPSRSVSAAIAEDRPGELRPIAVVGYEEPSLVFLLGENLALVDPQSAADFLNLHHNGLVVTDERNEIAFEQAAASKGVGLRETWSFKGINYSKGRRIRLALFERQDD